MGYFPFFMDIAGKKGVIVGGGKVAARKVEKLLLFEPKLTVIAPQIEECIRTQEKLLQKDTAAALCFMEREFRMEDLARADFVIAATDDEMLNGRISDYCKAKQIPVNVVDDREKCSFFFPALVKEGALTIGISTEGKSPVAASWVRKEISHTLPSGIGDVIDLIGQIRPRVMELDVSESTRKDLLEQIFLYCMEKDGEVTLEELMDEILLNIGRTCLSKKN
ncbi:MAG: bifunctional precorrin-2 dehydrogenase/sirohydrochlorin ferrochelatase [Lachnospiraceae bacterium]|nr:bifunctional precorrin-2 dehydrogenase/sirohydrochlorin ferrochelatase [Lachnospiraceae bacterium]